MNFGNVDDPTEIVDIRSAQLYSVSYLLTVASVNAG